ncbi:hypothetical protein B7P34_19320 [Streptosporangium nondiastaticum]|uniref:Uncharacterized protein n=1 Tax=Streptosporangium nondiastaticum TaxID=35764 RepID=A0A9X7JNT6_9ACTN|nr:hypothetical protein [Streptosporangium nondiastaticum]PSJ27092.1 hypothetical protein B7P34_19320 [Streptosporangium nondiastaticum]
MTTALAYTVHTSPALLHVSADGRTDGRADDRATLRITATNPGPASVTCDTITITIPAGKEPHALTATPETITARVAGTTGWHTEHRGGGVFHVRPTEPGTELKPGERIVITFADVVVNEAAGTATLGIGETTGSAGGALRERAGGGRKLVKAPAGAMLEDFRPDRTIVPNGETVTLTWKCVDGPDYELFYGDQREVVNGYITDGNGEWTSPPLHTATAFMLLGSTEEAGSPVTYGLTTAVTVDVPDLEVGSLDANGVVRLFGRPQEVAGGTTSGTWTYAADTDGVITGYIKTNQSGAPATLNVFVTPPDLKRQKFATQSWDVRGGTENQEASVLVPVPRGSTVSVVQKTDGGAFTAALTWFPFGTGPLRPIEQ